MLQAKYDSAMTTDENAAHWSLADALSADAAMTPQVRRTLVRRARYEVSNNSFASGIVDTICAYTVGSGPSLEVRTGDSELDDYIERSWREWAQEVRLAETLRVMRRGVVVDGESFGVMRCRYGLRHPVKLDLRLVEPEQVSEGWMLSQYQQPVEGIVLDEQGDPVEYHILRYHPGDVFRPLRPGDYDAIPAKYVTHYYHKQRPGQHRVVPEITPALPLFALLRRYPLATAQAAETAASFAAVLQTDMQAYLPRDAARYAQELALRLVNLRPRSATVLPPGWRLGQIESKHPTTTYGEYVYHIITEIARCLNVPVVVALGDSSRANFSSGRLDLRSWYRTIHVERSLIESAVLWPLWHEWWREWCQVNSSMLLQWGIVRPTVTWYWPPLEGVDPEKEAKAQVLRLQSHLTTLAREWAAQGKDWEEQVRQRGREISLLRELGLADSDVAPGALGSSTTDDAEQEEQ
jgi:lambda family phage portal protein